VTEYPLSGVVHPGLARKAPDPICEAWRALGRRLRSPPHSADFPCQPGQPPRTEAAVDPPVSGRPDHRRSHSSG